MMRNKLGLLFLFTILSYSVQAKMISSYSMIGGTDQPTKIQVAKQPSISVVEHKVYASFDLPFVSYLEDYKDWGLSVGYDCSMFCGNTSFFVGLGVKFSYYYGFEQYDEYDFAYTETSKICALGVPLNIGYKFKVSPDFSITPHAGLTPRFNLSAKCRVQLENRSTPYTDYTFSLFDEDEMGDAAFNELQLGGQLGIDFSYKNYVLGVEYYFGITDLSRYINMSQLSFSLGYKF